MGFFDKIKQGFKKTSDAVSHSLDSVFAAFVKISSRSSRKRSSFRM